MRSYIAFLKKEGIEVVRTHKLMLIVIVFVLIGMLNPITAKFTPQIIKEFMPEGMVIAINEPTAVDSWMQFFSNVPQMGLIVLVILFSGIMSNEFAKGTLINMLTKGLSRRVVIYSKFSISLIIWTISYVLCFLVTFIYTDYFWDTSNINNLFLAIFLLWLFGTLLLSTIILGGVIFKSNYACLLFTGTIVALMFLINIVPAVSEYNPVFLVSNNMQLIMDKIDIKEALRPIIIALAAILIEIYLSVKIFNKKEI